VLAVDRHQLGARRRPQRLDDRTGGDQALLVGQRQAPALPQRGDRDRQAGEPNDGVDDDVGLLDEVGEVVDDGGERQRGGNLGSTGRVIDGDGAGPELLRLGDQGLDRGSDAEGDDLVARRLGADDVQRLGSDRSGRAGDGDPCQVQGFSTSVT
jgi:hypothetical protein